MTTRDHVEVPLHVHVEADRLIPLLGISLALGLVITTLLFAWRRQSPPNLVGRVKADAYLAMARALIVLLLGLALALGGSIAGPAAFTAAPRWIALVPIVIGGVAFLARAALYLLRIKPQLDELSVPVAPASPAVGSREEGEE